MTQASLADAYALVGSGRIGEALRIIEVHAEAGSGEALFTLGDAYWRGMGVEQDMERARDLFRQSSDAGFPMAQKAYTNLLGNGHAGQRDWRKALERLEDEARQDPRRAFILRLVQSMSLDDKGDPARLMPAERLSERPDVRIFRSAFSAEECGFLRMVAEPTYQPTGVVLQPGDSIPAFVRTAEGSTIHWLIEDPAIHAMSRRLAALAGTDVYNGEPLQILRYRPGQEYRPHVDWLEQGNRRVMTALVYLNEDYEGGETAFVQTGLKVKGRVGDVLIFKSQAPDGNLDPLSEHAGLPVTRGTKYLASRWIREGRHVL